MLKIILPLVLLLTLSRLWHKSMLTTSTIVLIFMFTLMPASMSPVSLSHMFSLDPLSFTLIALTLWITPLIMSASQKVALHSKMPSTFVSLLAALVLLLSLSFSVNNLFLFYVMFEASLIPTLLIILIWGYQPERLQAGMYLMMYTITASLPLLAAIAALVWTNHNLNMFITSDNTSFMLPLQWVMLNTAFMVKLPMFLSHLWLPKAHVEAPVAGSMILAGVLLKLGGYGMLRMLSMMSPLCSSAKISIACLGLWGGVITSLICVRQPDLKSLIAYSSVGHMSLTLVGVLTNNVWGVWGALNMMLAHGLLSSSLFASANMTYECSTSRNLILNKGMNIMFPAMSLTWFIMAAANMAAPPSINLLAEIMLMTSSLMMFLPSAIPLALMSFLAATYSLLMYTNINHGSSNATMNFLITSQPRNLLILYAHTIPVFMLILGPSFISVW